MSNPTPPDDPNDVIPASKPVPAGQAASDLSLPETDETALLIERAKTGDSEALNELFSRHHGLMVEMARRKIGPRLKQKEDPYDLAQTTFREATRDFGQYEYRGDGSFLRWLMQILHNKIRDKAEYYGATKRDIGRERSSDERMGDSGDLKRFDPPSSERTPTQVLAREEEFEILRTAITLVFFQGLSLRQAGERMAGRSEDAVRMLLRRAEAHLLDLTRARLAK